jgi:hypothetical protein
MRRQKARGNLGLCRFWGFLARTCGGVLHRILHRNCTGFCTASGGPLEVLFRGQ